MKIGFIVLLGFIWSARAENVFEVDLFIRNASSIIPTLIPFPYDSSTSSFPNLTVRLNCTRFPNETGYTEKQRSLNDTNMPCVESPDLPTPRMCSNEYCQIYLGCESINFTYHLFSKLCINSTQPSESGNFDETSVTVRAASVVFCSEHNSPNTAEIQTSIASTTASETTSADSFQTTPTFVPTTESATFSTAPTPYNASLDLDNIAEMYSDDPTGAAKELGRVAEEIVNGGDSTENRVVFTERLPEFFLNLTEPFNATTTQFHIHVEVVNDRSASPEIVISDYDLGVSVPGDVLQGVFNTSEVENEGSTSQGVNIILIHYANDFFFQSNTTAKVSQIVSLDVSRGSIQPLRDLDNPIALRFRNATEIQIDPRSGRPDIYYRCVFWNYTESNWSSDGCELTQNATCECSHTTNFALLINQNATPDPALTIISMIGLILSICGLFITLIVHLIYRDLRKRRPARVLMHISFNLLLGYLIYVVGLYQTQNYDLCVTITFFLHFFFLAAFGWMTVYSYDMYISLVKVFDSHQSFFLRKCGGLAYTAALVISVITLVVGISADNKYATEEKDKIFYKKNICWMDGNAFYYGFVLPIGIMFFFNIIVFIMVFREIVGQSKVISSASKHTAKQRFVVAVTMISFTGLTWVFAFLLLTSSRADAISNDPANDYITDSVQTKIFNWLFAIFNSLQGFGIFLLTVVKRKETRKLWWTPIKSKFTDAMTSVSTKSSYSTRSDGEKDGLSKTVGIDASIDRSTEQERYVTSTDFKSSDGKL